MSGEHPEYDIIGGESQHDLIDAVNEMIECRWRPIGSIAIIHHANETIEYLQPMMRWPKLNTERKSEQ